MTEINKDFYCSTMGMWDCPNRGDCLESGCGDYHRKWPTPKQFKEEYGEEWEGQFIVCVLIMNVIRMAATQKNGEQKIMDV